MFVATCVVFSEQLRIDQIFIETQLRFFLFDMVGVLYLTIIVKSGITIIEYIIVIRCKSPLFLLIHIILNLLLYTLFLSLLNIVNTVVIQHIFNAAVPIVRTIPSFMELLFQRFAVFLKQVLKPLKIQFLLHFTPLLVLFLLVFLFLLFVILILVFLTFLVNVQNLIIHRHYSN